jgi:predicted NBD/HSP70 family sugar kinase
VHRPVVVAVPVHLRPAGRAAAAEAVTGRRPNRNIVAIELGRGVGIGACLGLEKPVLSPAAVSTSRRSSGAAAIEGGGGGRCEVLGSFGSWEDLFRYKDCADW